MIVIIPGMTVCARSPYGVRVPGLAGALALQQPKTPPPDFFFFFFCFFFFLSAKTTTRREGCTLDAAHSSTPIAGVRSWNLEIRKYQLQSGFTARD